MYKWQTTYIDYLKQINNNQLFEEYNNVGTPDDYCGCYSKQQAWKLEVCEQELKNRLIKIGFLYMEEYKGIDQREIKCCDREGGTIQAGISFQELVGGNGYALKFHFLEYIGHNIRGLKQTTKTMHLDKENTQQLIKALKSLRFKNK